MEGNRIIERNKKLLEWFSGDPEAVEFLLLISDITELWDDLIDADVPISEQRIHNAFLKAIFELPTNAFYQRHRAYLMPIMHQAANSWLDANRLIKHPNGGKQLAFVLRNMDIQVAHAIVYITGGWGKLREVSAEMWVYFGLDQDDYGTWIAEGRP